MAGCLRPGGGMENRSLDEARAFQRQENEGCLRNATGTDMQVHRTAVQHTADLRQQIEVKRDDDGQLPMHVGMRKFPIQFLKMALMDDMDKADDNGFSQSQEDSGAGMHLQNDLEDYVLGYTTEFDIYAGSADKGKDMVKLSAVGPMIRVFVGTDSKGRSVRTIRNIGPAGAISDGNWASLTSHNGIVRERIDDKGGERDLDNTFDVQKQTLIFDVSDDEKRVNVPMIRRNGGLYLQSRRPTAAELATYLEQNPSMAKWTFSGIMTAVGDKYRCNKVSLRGQLHDAMVHASDWGLDRLIRARALDGIDKVPLSGVDEMADHEIKNCGGCKAKMVEKAHASTVTRMKFRKMMRHLTSKSSRAHKSAQTRSSDLYWRCYISVIRYTNRWDHTTRRSTS
jgi:hypothetical protein